MTEPLPYVPRAQHDDDALRHLAYHDAMRSIRMEIPEPEEYAKQLPLNAVNALLGASMRNGAWCVSEVRAAMLRPYSLVEARGPYLSAFGFAVRKVLLRHYVASAPRRCHWPLAKMACVIVWGAIAELISLIARHAKYALAFCQGRIYKAAQAFVICSKRNRGSAEEQRLAYTPQHVANFFIDCAKRDGKSLDPLKLIKLVYIAYGWVLALTNQRLFDEGIEAWKHGPVIPSIYHEFKHNRYSHIEEKAGEWDMETGDFVTPEVPPSDATTRMILEKVWAAYGRFSGWALRNKTHEQGTPWSETYDGTLNKVIPDDLISPHFHKKIREIVDAARAV